MRTLLCAALLPASALVSFAQTPAAPAAPAATAVPAEAVLMQNDDTFMDIWIIAATKTDIRFLESKVDTDFTDMKISRARSLYLKEPKEFTQAIDLFQARKYEEAKALFGTLKARYKFMEAMPGNYSALSAFYEMECMRKLGDLEGIAAAMQRFIPDPLLREEHRQQVELYSTFWDAVRTKGWQRIDSMAKERAGQPLPANLRAQMAYCHGLALEGLKKNTEALNAYNTALVADCGAADDLVGKAALNILRIHKADPEVQKAMRLWGTPDEVKHAGGRVRLLEASAVAHMYQKFIVLGTPLPAAYQDLLKYKTEDEKAAAPADKDAEK
jgi:tetratricopeptide (TPR) repeat protein